MRVSTLTINEIYTRCLLSSQEEHANCITVPGMMGNAHIFYTNRIQKNCPHILSALHKLPRIMCHSHNPNGAPWIVARSHTSGYEGCTLGTAERLIVMGIAIGAVRIIKREDPVTDIPYVTIDDDRLIRIEKMKPPSERRRFIIRWEK